MKSSSNMKSGIRCVLPDYYLLMCSFYSSRVLRQSEGRQQQVLLLGLRPNNHEFINTKILVDLNQNQGWASSIVSLPSNFRIDSFLRGGDQCEAKLRNTSFPYYI